MLELRTILGTSIAVLMLTSLAERSRAQDVGSPAPQNPANEDAEEKPAAVSDSTWRRPLSSRNQFPFALQFVYMAPDRAGALPDGRSALEIQFDYSNIISGQETERERLLLDLEYLRTNVRFRRGLPKRIEVGVSIPFYAYYGGFLDGFVGGFHELFNLPNFLRSQTENGLTQLQFTTGEMTRFDRDDGFSSVGDISLHFKKTMLERKDSTLAARAQLKLPTGAAERLGGSGSTDVGLGVAFDRIRERWALYVNGNYHFLGEPDRLTSRDFFSFMVGADYRLKPRLTAHIQYDFARPFIDSDLPIFNESAQQLALGLRWRFSDRFVHEWAFVEDFSDVSPDFTVSFQIGIHWQRESEAP